MSGLDVQNLVKLKVWGSTSGETLVGGGHSETFIPGAGIDTVNAGGGDDTIFLAGNESEFDTINGGPGVDRVFSFDGEALVLNGFNAAAASIEIWRDDVDGNASGNVFDFRGLTMPDTPGATFTVYGHGGGDTVFAPSFGIEMRGQEGNDVLNGGDGKDIFYGGTGTDTMNGGGGNDTFFLAGTADEFDTVNGGAGIDTVDTASSPVVVYLNGFDAGAASIEVWDGDVRGNNSANVFDFRGVSTTGFTVRAGGGGDIVFAPSAGLDMRGEEGNDVLTGGNGTDTFYGGPGTDTMKGGGGNDVFVLTGSEDEFDTIKGGAGTDYLVSSGDGDGDPPVLNGFQREIRIDRGLGINRHPWQRRG